MSRDAIFRFRLTETEAERLDREAREADLSKADLIRKRLGWDTADRGVRPAVARERIAAAPTTTPVDPDRQPGLSAIQQIAKKLGGKV